MGATVTTGKRAAAFRTHFGNTSIYVLFEQTYEKNCHPHTPNWGCCAIGDIAAVMERIFAYASSCEGGMLQGRGGQIAPEGYIRGWLQELFAPIEFEDRTIRIERGNGSLYDTIPPEVFATVEKSLREIARGDLLDRLSAGESVELELYRDIDVILALYGRGKLQPWRIIRHFSGRSEPRCPELGYSPKPVARCTPERPDILRVDEENRLLRRADGSWYCAGWAYSVIGDFVRDLWKVELNEPGTYAGRIRAYRDAVHNAPPLPLSGVTVKVDSTATTNSYHRRSIDDFAREYPVTATATGFEVQPTTDNLYRLTILPDECTSWAIPAAAAPSLF